MSSSHTGCFIEAIATAVPDKALSQECGTGLLVQACINPRTARLLQRVAKLTGIEKRYLAALDYQPEGREDQWLYRRPDVQPKGPGMSDRTAAFRKSAEQLVCKMLEQLSPETMKSLQTLITVSCTHASSPGLEEPIFAHADVPVTVDRWNLGFMGCSAGLAGLRLFHQTAALRRRGMVVACELSSLHFQYTDQIDQMTANLLFADGIAALVLSPEPTPARVVGCRCISVPQYAPQMVWFAGDHGLQLELSQDLPETLGAHLREPVEQFLSEHGLTVDKIDHWLVHPGGPQILDAVEGCLALPAGTVDLSRSVLRRYGNMSSPTVFFILKELLATNDASGHAVMMAFGPGLTIELALLELGAR